jgi:hypothetical protein
MLDIQPSCPKELRNNENWREPRLMRPNINDVGTIIQRGNCIGQERQNLEIRLLTSGQQTVDLGNYVK